PAANGTGNGYFQLLPTTSTERRVSGIVTISNWEESHWTWKKPSETMRLPPRLAAGSFVLE
ncbi:MAG: hypothetical protein NTZ98_02560, partial [Acidobacteria bacterium]|nr:hypothetical protein [Acidobacteriota bacterium]